MQDYTPPTFLGDAYHCPLCNVYAHQIWFANFQGTQKGIVSFNKKPYQKTHQKIDDLTMSVCECCSGQTLWFNESVIIPHSSIAPLASPDLPADIAEDFNEARAVLAISSRASAALLRLVVQKLCKHLGQAGKNINDDIKKLVESGLSLGIQQSLEIVRVVGNNAVHPGAMDVRDKPEIAFALFKVINFIVSEMITKPNEIKAIYDGLPTGAKEEIEKRDKNAGKC
jgi:hypothetical protein